jgi:hypothetical protein
MLKASLSTNTIFTDVLLSKGTDDQDARPTVKPASGDQKIKLNLGSLSESQINLFYDRQEKCWKYQQFTRRFNP